MRLRDLVQVLLNSRALTPDSALEELEELRATLRDQDREQDEDAVMDVMEFLLGWCSQHVRLRVDNDASHIVIIRPGTAARVLTDAAEADQWRDLYFPRTALEHPRLAVLDLIGYFVTPGFLERFLVPLGRGIRSRTYGQLSVVVRTHDASTAAFVRLLAAKEGLPFYVSLAASDEELGFPEPVGLSSVEGETLSRILDAGGVVTAADFAEAAAIAPTAASNRLAGLAEEGFVFRFPPAPGQRSDVYADPRRNLSREWPAAIKRERQTRATVNG